MSDKTVSFARLCELIACQTAAACAKCDLTDFTAARFVARPRILIVDDEPGMALLVKEYLGETGYEFEISAGKRAAQGALEVLEQRGADVVVEDYLRPGQLNGIELLNEIQRLHPGVPVILLTGFAEVSSAVKAMREGAFDYIEKPFRPEDYEQLRAAVARALKLTSPRGSGIKLDDRGRLHNLSGPAVLYPDGFAIYAIHGVPVPQKVVDSPGLLAPEQILTEPNAEVRRVMIERFGQDRFMREGHAVLVSEDRRGRLFRVDLPNDEPLVMVEVVNSTPEPDGSWKKYMIRVPPDVRTARQAVAWTFGRTAAEYTPLVQT